MIKENKVNEGELVLYSTVLSIYNYYNKSFTKEINDNILLLLDSLEKNRWDNSEADIDKIELIEKITYQDKLFFYIILFLFGCYL